MSKSIVTYFSITGVTAGMASMLAHAIGADLYEIKPEAAYEDAERSLEHDYSEQQKNPSDIRIKFQHQNLNQYDTIYLGLPIWWYAAPTIIHTFLDSYDLTGKTVIPFATSGGGGIDKVRTRLLDSCQGADLKEAALLLGDLTEEELATWAAEASK